MGNLSADEYNLIREELIESAQARIKELHEMIEPLSLLKESVTSQIEELQGILKSSVNRISLLTEEFRHVYIRDPFYRDWPKEYSCEAEIPIGRRFPRAVIEDGLSNLELSHRTTRVLKENGMDSSAVLKGTSFTRLYRIKGFGRGCERDLLEALSQSGGNE